MQETVLFVKKLKEYAKAGGWNKHEIDMLEEAEELLVSTLPPTQKQKEFSRIGILLQGKVNQKDEKKQEEMSRTDKEEFVKKLNSRLMQCWDRICKMGRQRALEARPEIDLFKGEIRSACCANANYAEMSQKQNFRKLLMSKVENFNINLRKMTTSFAQEILTEYDRCFSQIKKQLLDTTAAEFKISEKEWYQKGEKNIDMLHSEVKATADYSKLDQTPFETFAQECGEKAEKTAKKHKRVTDLFRILPILLYLIKYIVDTYILQQESLTEKLLNMLLERMIDNGENTVDGILKVLEFALPLLKDSSQAVSFGVNFMFSVIFFGWLYLIYILIINKIRRKSLVTQLQTCVEDQVNGFLGSINLEQMVADALEAMEIRIKKLYMDHYVFLNERLILAIPNVRDQEAEKAREQLNAFYSEYERLCEKAEGF